MAIPSQTAIAGNSIGVPPAERTPAFTASAIFPRWICPGTISLAEFTTPISGRSISFFVSPRAESKERWAERSFPFFMMSLRIV